MALFTRHQGERKGSIMSPEPEWPPVWPAQISSVFRPPSDLDRVLGSRPTHGKKITVRPRPGPNHGLSCQVQCRHRAPPQPESKAEGQVDRPYPSRVPIHIEVPIRPRQSRERQVGTEQTREADRQAYPGVRELGSLPARQKAGVIKNSGRCEPVRATDDVKAGSDRPAITQPVRARDPEVIQSSA